MRKPLEIFPLTAEEVEALDTLYRTSKDTRLRTRAQIVLLAGEQRMTAPTLARIVRETDQTVRNWGVSLPSRRHRGTQRSSDAGFSIQDHEGVRGAVR